MGGGWCWGGEDFGGFDGLVWSQIQRSMSTISFSPAFACLSVGAGGRAIPSCL